MTSILEVYKLTCNACGKAKKVSRLHVDGNLNEIERNWVCPECREQGAEPGDATEKTEETAAS